MASILLSWQGDDRDCRCRDPCPSLRARMARVDDGTRRWRHTLPVRRSRLRWPSVEARQAASGARAGLNRTGILSIGHLLDPERNPISQIDAILNTSHCHPVTLPFPLYFLPPLFVFSQEPTPTFASLFPHAAIAAVYRTNTPARGIPFPCPSMHVPTAARTHDLCQGSPSVPSDSSSTV